MGKLNTLKDSLSIVEGANRELTEKVASSSREVERLRSEVASLTSAQDKSSGEITHLTVEKDRAEKKVTKLTAALEEKKTKFENVVSESKSAMSRLEEENNKVVASQKETSDMALEVGKEFFGNAIEQIRLLKPDLQFSTEGLDVRLTMVGNQLVEISACTDGVEDSPFNGEGV